VICQFAALESVNRSDLSVDADFRKMRIHPRAGYQRIQIYRIVLLKNLIFTSFSEQNNLSSSMEDTLPNLIVMNRFIRPGSSEFLRFGRLLFTGRKKIPGRKARVRKLTFFVVSW
jgi:hypothetical protein